MGMYKTAGREAGYTIIEVTLFLGISSLLFVMTMIGTGNSIRTTRFSDSSRSMTVYFQKQFNDLANGVNTRAADHACNGGAINSPATQTPGTSDCILMGRVIEFKQGSDRLVSYGVVGTTPSGADADVLAQDDELIYSYRPRVIRQAAVDTYQIPWRAGISGTKRDGNSLAFDTVLFIYNPTTSEIKTDLFKRPNNDYIDVAALINPADAADANNTNQTGNICLLSADGGMAPSRLYLGGGSSQGAMQLYYDARPEDCNGV